MATHFTDNLEKKMAMVILAGGQGRRMGGIDKSLVKLSGKPLIQHVIDRIQIDVSPLILSTNKNQSNLQHFGLPCVDDTNEENRGPLAGLSASLCHIEKYHADIQWVFSTPADCPFVPLQLASTLLDHACSGDGMDRPSYVRCGKRDHYLTAIWPISCSAVIAKQLANGVLSIHAALKSCNAQAIDFTDDYIDAFMNINTPQDLRSAEEIINAGNCRTPSKQPL